jgi:hypothetical protein
MTVPLASTWAELGDTWAGLDSLWARGVFVELGAFTGLTLDDENLGRLDFNPLDGDIAYRDVTDFVNSVSLSRGKARDLEQVSAGQLSVSFRNEGRDFDPAVPGDLREYVVPRKPVRVSANGTPVFTGFVDDWNFNYSMGGLAIASIEASDGFSFLARQENAGGTAPAESSGDRVERVLDQLTVQWPLAKRDIAAGQTTFETGTLEGNALQYLQKIAASESSLLFVSKDGDLTFLNRLIQPVTNATTFSDRGEGVSYEEIAVSYGTEELTNRAVITSGAGTAISEDATSQVTFGITERDLDTFLSSVPQLEALGDYIVFRYGVPEYRIERVTVNLNRLGSADLDKVLALELGEQADVVFQPPGGGPPVALRNRVIGIAHDVGLSEHLITFNFESLPFTFFILDDATFGKLDDDAGVLGF